MKSSVISEVVEASFSIYQDSDRRDALSACQITNLQSLDEDENPIPGGLYDLCMGPIHQRQVCGTCKSNYVACGGHAGHIELDVPVYYPLFFKELVRLLKIKCMSCHKLRMATSRVRYYLLRLMLLEMGDIEESNTLFDLVAPSQLDKTDGEAGVSTGEDITENRLKEIEINFKRFCKSRTMRSKPDVLIQSLQRELIEQFHRACLVVKRCENCSAFSPQVRKDGSAKIFQKPIPLRQRKSMGSSMRQKSGLHALKKQTGDIEDDDTEDENLDDEQEESEEENDESNLRSGLANAAKTTTQADKYLPPMEVEAQITLMWQHNAEILNFIWCRSLGKTARDVDLRTVAAWKIFFMRVVLVPPNRFRPMGKVGDVVSDHPQNAHLKKILECNYKLQVLQGELGQPKADSTDSEADEAAKSTAHFSKLASGWIDLQNAVNCYMDSAKDPNPLGSQNAPIGIRQLLERKEGLFRRHMMGKRVNYCCRSVISPDPYMGSNEIGIPVHFAKNLTFPTPVNSWNVKHMRTLVERGPDQYPGANQIELADGRVVKLNKLSAMERAGKAKLLLSTPGIKVYRHLIDGDVLLVNRQPTLHKPGIMAHKARVLQHVKEQTLRMNYANCNTYNADFDGDEMNCHFVQSELARSEAYNICNTDNQYIVPTSGNPLRGLIQDHVASAVKMTCKDTFLDRSEFQQLVYIAVSGLSGTEIIGPTDEIRLPPPAILRPKALWTGKQVITALISHLCRPPLPPLNLDSKARTPPTAFGAEHSEHEVIIRRGELLSGVLDKNAIGSVSLGVVHAVYELYGAELAGRLLNAFGRLFTYYLQNAGHSCGISDLVLTADADAQRRELLKQVTADAHSGLEAFLALHVQGNFHAKSTSKEDMDVMLRAKVASFMASERVNGKVKLDGAMQSVINQSASSVIKACLPNGLQVSFLQNNFSMMVLTGAKGSAVNQSQISCFLGQQALEGQRVPVMVSGKTLPAFKAFDGSARAGGFVRDRFLTGVKPQEYYFHCMAGREGLVDTAVKTSRSGYLQRCLVKHLEELTVAYDMTVRDSGGNVIQFLYGEDGLDPVSAGLLGGKPNQMLFLARNNQAFTFKYSLFDDFFQQGLEYNPAVAHHRMMKRAKEAMALGDISKLDKNAVVLARRKIDPAGDWEVGNLHPSWMPVEVLKVRSSEKKHKLHMEIRYLADSAIEKKVPLIIEVEGKHPDSSPSTGNGLRLPLQLIKLGMPEDTAMSSLCLGTAVGACSERMQACIDDYCSKNPDNVITDVVSNSSVKADALELLIWVKYMRSLACPGEAVGCVAAQSVGEPSTQMTLNTFHLAGHGGANVTLGIPRLREVIMTASKDLKTPTMTIPLVKGRTLDAAKSLARKLSCLPLATLLSHQGGVEVGESLIRASSSSRWERRYRIRLHFEAAKHIEKAFGVVFDTVVATVKKGFMAKVDWLMKQEQRRAGESTSGKNDALKAFRSAAKPSKKKGAAAEDEDGEAADGEAEEVVDVDEDKPKAGGSDSEESDDSDSDADSQDDGKNIRAAGGYGVNGEGEIDGSDSEEEGNGRTSGEEEDDTEPAKDQAKSKGKEMAKSADTGVVIITDKVSYNEKEAWVEVCLLLPSHSRRLLMAQLVEKAAAVTMVRSTKNISRAHAMEDKDAGKVSVQTEGVNLEAIWALPDSLVSHSDIQCNDINQVLLTYGVEAARKSIVSEIQAVFAVYGIDVNPRHLSLIADFMTRNGDYTPMNRIGMNSCPSPFLQMSFETTVTFLTRAAQEGIRDDMMSASARIVTGSLPKCGTGAFNLMVPLSTGSSAGPYKSTAVEDDYELSLRE